ncbi:MAG: glycosyl transferase family 2, partial [Daejeonella sp.]|nr:glycosyl transferase family 2 [Daejeonella sp.]
KPIDWLIESLSCGQNMMQCGLWLIPRTLLKKSGLWNEKFSLINDFDFLVRVILSAEQILFTKGAILYYRSGLNDSLSKQTSYESMKSALLSIEAGIETMLSHENSSRVSKVAADTMQLWMYNFFPNHLDLYEKAKKRIFELGGSNFDFPSGGKTRILVTLIGWKMTKRIKYILRMFCC